ncbi:hypothetical protein ONZ43_g2729 [Nemania bipapillata]|uniref:Uncharacterized protein n=1 Tax=Nemania bipapillata TaxID=110536 RepID=A0ACC2IZJ6_9PEZI|nr:hypothetical protein ONZ43_g2729 [Nemania bipapillata]
MGPSLHHPGNIGNVVNIAKERPYAATGTIFGFALLAIVVVVLVLKLDPNRGNTTNNALTHSIFGFSSTNPFDHSPFDYNHFDPIYFIYGFFDCIHITSKRLYTIG